jgi:hypothetical protein
MRNSAKNARTSNQASCDKEALKKNGKKILSLVQRADKRKGCNQNHTAWCNQSCWEETSSAFEIMQRGIEAEAESRRKQYLPLPPRPITMAY